KELDWDLVGDSGRIARLRMGPELVHRPVVLDFSYQLVQERTAGSGLLTSLLRPPQVPAALPNVPTRWQVDLPSTWLPLAPEEGPDSERVWGRRGWLLAAKPTVTVGDLERWFAGSENGPNGTSPGPTSVSAEAAARVPALTCWRSSLET